MREKKRLLEAVLFAGEGLVSVKKANQVLNTDDDELKLVVKNLQEEYENRSSGFSIGFKQDFVEFGVKTDLVPIIKDFIESEFSGATLKTLALIAFQAPIIQSSIINARGNKGYEHIKELIGMGLIEAKLHKNTKMVYLTPKFYKYFQMDKKRLKEKLEKVREQKMKKKNEN